jgi:FAD/FMN-containing dehydrogenase/alkanesulfonate monooxygenase SsuD/methylene tetrahydromethanopterin reductase-like flavin-dependent oxidoreductase (luciferase family)
VLNLPLRQPAVLARSVASLDLLTGGRIDLGLGAGGFWDAIASLGADRLTPAESVTALSEAIEIIRGIWDAGERRVLRVDGEHHRVSGAKRGPAPAHDIPIWIGAYKPRMLRLVGRQADGWLPSYGYLKDGDLARGNAVIDEAALQAGRHPAQVRRLLNLQGTVAARSAGFLQGPVEQWVDELSELALTDGIGTFVVATDDPTLTAVLGEEIAPAVRERVAAERATAGTAPAVTHRGSAAVALRRDGIDYAGLPTSLAERAVEPGDRAYAQVRHNYLRSGAPGLVLRPRSAAEVADAVRFASTQDVPLGVRSGGHGISGRSTNDGGIVVDLGAFDHVQVVDEATRRVRIGVGATWASVAERLSPLGWAISSGDSGGVGVGGLATAGGIGFLGRVFGLTIDHVVAAEVVTADGRIVHASADENPDLLWGLRGAGGNLGVVTWVEIEAMEVGNVVFSQMALDASDAAGLLERWGAVVESAPRELTSFLILSPERRGQGAVAQLMTVWAGDDPEAAVAQLERLADVAPLLGHQAYLLPYSGVVQAADKHHTGGGDPAVRSALVDHLDATTAQAFARVATSGRASFLQVRATGGAAHDVAVDATAYAHRHQNFLLSAMSPSQDLLDTLWDAEMGPVADGLYLSFETDTRPERLTDAFPPATLDRLRRVKRDWDPQNLFRANFPVTPADA